MCASFLIYLDSGSLAGMTLKYTLYYLYFNYYFGGKGWLCPCVSQGHSLKLIYFIFARKSGMRR